MTNQEIKPPIKKKPQLFYGYFVVAAAFLIMLVSMGFYDSFGVFFKPISKDFNWSRALTSGAFSLSQLVRGLMGILMGGFTDKLGARKVLTVCGFLMGSGFLLVSQINNAWHLYLLYVVIIGIGTSGVWVPLLSTVAKWFTKRRSMMTGIVIAGLHIGTLVFPPVNTWLISIYDWRITYLIMGGIVFMVVILLAQFLRHKPDQMGQLAYGESESKKKGVKSETVGFTFKEAVYTNQFWFAVALAFCVGFWRMAITVHIIPHVTDLGFSTASSANVLATMGGLSIPGVMIGGSIADRIGSRKAYLISFILLLAASFWLLQAKELWMLYLFAIIFGLGGGMVGPLHSPLLAALFGLRSHGVIFGATNVGFTIGAALGPYMAGYIFDITGSYQRPFLTCAVVGIVGFICAALLRPTKRLGGRI